MMAGQGWRARGRNGALVGARPAALALAAVLIALPAAADPVRETLGRILQELGVERAAEPDKAEAAEPAPLFSEAERREIEAIVEAALAERGVLPFEGVGTIAAPEGASTDLLDAGQAEALRAALAAFGPAEMGVTSAGAPFVTGEMEGVRYRLDFQDCGAPDGCRDVMFTARFDGAPASLEQLNAWNREHRYGVGYRDESGALWLRMSVNLFGGVTAANWADTADWWRIAAFEFREAVFSR